MIEGMFSVIVPVYNVEQFLPRCVKSILKQLNDNFELILVDDGSTDCSGKICDEYAKSYRCCRVIHQINKGLSAARNKGTEEAKGEYICFVDADDYIEKELLTKVSYYLDMGYDMVSFCGSRVSEHGKWLYEIIPNEDLTKEFDFSKIDKTAFILRHFLEYEIGWEAWNAVYRAKIIERAHLCFDTEIKYAEDKVFTFQYLLQCDKIVKMPDLLYNYTLRSGSITDNRSYIEDINYANENFLQMKDMVTIDETIFYFSVVLYYYRIILKKEDISFLVALLKQADDQEVQIKYYNRLRNKIQELKKIFNDKIGTELIQALLIINKGYER